MIIVTTGINNNMVITNNYSDLRCKNTLLDPEPFLSKLNTEEAYRQIPLIVFLGTLSVVGVFGNTLVISIYGHVYKYSNSRTFIMCLSVVDLCTCAIAVPIEISTTLNQYQFRSLWTCKISRFTNIFTTITSATVLVLIAVDRYRKICRPLNWQITNEHSNILCLACVCVGLLLAWPALALYGIQSTEVILSPDINGTATECSMDDKFNDTSLPLVYQAINTFTFLVGVCSLIVLYIFIIRRVRFFSKKREARCGSISNGLDNVIYKKESKKARRKKLEKLKSEVSVSEDDGWNASTDSKLVPLKSRGSFSQSSTLQRGQHNISLLDLSTTQAKKTKKINSLARNTTYLMFIISVVFILNFVPVLTLILVREVKRDFVDNLNDSQRTVYRFFLRSYFLNAAVNPIIYSVFDRRFRKAVKFFLTKVVNMISYQKGNTLT